MPLIQRAQLSFSIGLLAWIAYGAQLQDVAPIWWRQWYVVLMSGAPVIVSAFLSALVLGVLSYRTSMGAWWYPGGLIPRILLKVSLLGLVAVTSLPRSAPSWIESWRLTGFIFCLFGSFFGIMGFSRAALLLVEQENIGE